MTDDMLERVKKTIRLALMLDESSAITSDTHFERDLKVDSIGVVEMMLHVEDEFGLEFSDSEIANTNTVGQVVEIVDKRAVRR